MSTEKDIKNIPRAPLYLLGLCALVAILYIGQELIVPLVFAGLFSIMLSSVVNRMIDRGISRSLAVFLTVVPTLLIILAFGIIFISQLSNFVDAFPKIVEKFKLLTGELINWLSDSLNINPAGFKNWLSNFEKDLINKSGGAIGYTISTMSNMVVNVVLVPVYVFMMLYYQPIIVGFISNVFGWEYRGKVNEILPVSKDIIKSYLVGLIIETAIVSTLNTIGLLVWGIDYALLLGIIGGLLNIIPYLGAIIAVTLYIVVALVTKPHPSYALFVFINYLVIQFIDNNFLVPKIIGSKVKLNAFVSIVAVIAGGAIWGISGMFLSIPMVAVTKVICDKIEPLQAWGFLLGDTMPAEPSRMGYFKRFKKRKSLNGIIQ